jgi:DNA-binding MarR family transcriptional regulator
VSDSKARPAVRSTRTGIRAGTDPDAEGRSEAEFVDALSASPTLAALRELINTAPLVGPAVARRVGLNHSELNALELLMEHQRGPVELARLLRVTSAASSGIVDRLVAHGHAVREPDEHDRRRTRVLITNSARQEVLGQLMPMFVALKALDDALTPAERDAVDRYLRGALEAVRRLL